MYQRPDFWVRPWQILRWRIATSMPQSRTAGPDAGLCIPTYVLGIRQTHTSESLGPIDILCGNLHQGYPQHRLISKVHKIHFDATSKHLFSTLDTILLPIRISTLLFLSCCLLVWSKGLMQRHLMTVWCSSFSLCSPTTRLSRNDTF